MAVPDARFARDDLLHLYEREEAGTDAKDGLAVALAAVADDAVMDDLVALAQDRSNGHSRVFLLEALARSRRPDAREALQRLAADADVAPEATRLLRRGSPN